MGVTININDVIESETAQEHKAVIDKFRAVVTDLKTLLCASDTYVLYIPVSFGKDSKIVAIAALEAYRQAISEELIESERPLIMVTIDTNSESLPMTMYPHYCIPRMEAYAQDEGINLFHSIVSPSFYDEYANRYLGAQKLIPNSTRAGDCSVILKVQPAESFLKGLRDVFSKNSKLKNYAECPVVCCTGQRIDESARRSSNMNKQGVATRSLDDLIADMTDVTLTSVQTVYNYAPIRAWTTDEAFLANELAGARPLTRNLLGHHNAIPSFLPDHALMLAIYGNAAQEQCEIAIGSTAQSGCNGKARYGCGICTMIGAHDKTQSSLATMERWNFLGQTELLALRDYMYRLSLNLDARGFHAKAVDPVGYNRIALQANVLKPEYLEQLVRLFSQLTILSEERAQSFSECVSQGKSMEHPAMLEIANDVSLNAKAKRAYLDMYQELAQKPLIKLFSERHAVYLSFRWSLDGIQSLPYTPLAIWHETISDKSKWIDWPDRNDEYQKKHNALSMCNPSNVLPDAVMMPVLAEEMEQPDRYLNTPDVHNILALHSYHNNVMSLTSDHERDCSSRLQHEHHARVSFHCRYDVSIADVGERVTALLEDQRAVIFCIQLNECVLERVSVDNRSVSPEFHSLMAGDTFRTESQQYYQSFIDHLTELLSMRPFKTYSDAHDFITRAITQRFVSTGTRIDKQLPYWKLTDVGQVYKEQSRRVMTPNNFTRRRLRKVAGKWEKGTTRLNFYPLSVDCRLHKSRVDEVKLYELNFSEKRVTQTYTSDYDFITNDTEIDTSNITVSQSMIDRWRAVGGLARALEDHYEQKSLLITENRRLHRKPTALLQFTSCGPVEQMLRYGVVAIENSYFATFNQIRMRSEFFAQIGAYDYQSLSYDELSSLPWTISMRKHRQDKAKVLMALRERFRMQRETIRKADAHAGPTRDLIKAFASNVSSYAQLYLDTSMADIFKAQFNTGSVSYSSQAAASWSWLEYHAPATSNVDGLLKALLPFSLQKRMRDSDDYLELGKRVQQQFKQVMVQLTTYQNQWSSLYDALSTLIQSYRNNMALVGVAPIFPEDFPTFSDYIYATTQPLTNKSQELRQSMLADFRQIITRHHPQLDGALFEPDAGYWKPNLCVLWSELVRMQTRAKQTFGQFNLLLERVSKLIGSAGLEQFRNMELASQLVVSHQLPVNSSSVIQPSRVSVVQSVSKSSPTMVASCTKGQSNKGRTRATRRDHTAILLGL